MRKKFQLLQSRTRTWRCTKYARHARRVTRRGRRGGLAHHRRGISRRRFEALKNTKYEDT